VAKTVKQVLTIQDAEKQVKEMQGFRSEISKSKNQAGSFLKSTGMYDKNGKLKKLYK
jgi:hypothetical protein